MSYSDPYYNQNQHPQQQHYQDAPFDPYQVQQQHQPQQEYGQAGYATYGGTKEAVKNGFEDDVVPAPIGEKTPGNMRRWRKDFQGNLWTKGSRARCFGRFFCCTLMIFVFLLVSVVLSLALWLRPPNIIVGQPTPDINSFAIANNSISIAMPVDISITNPNYFTVTLVSLDAAVIYPVNNTQVGSGHMSKIDFKDHTQTNFTFPITIEYKASSDPSGAVITDLAKHCGVDPNVPASDVTVTVNIKVKPRVMLVSFSTMISQKVTFSCPLGGALSQFEDLLKGLGINVNELGSLAGLLTR